MSKKRKPGSRSRHHGGGRVTPKGTRPDGSSSGPARGTRAGGGPSGPAGTPGFSLAQSSGPFASNEPVRSPEADGPLDDVIAELTRIHPNEPLLIELWASDLVGTIVSSLRPEPTFDDLAAPIDGGTPERPPTEEEFFGNLVDYLTARADDGEGLRFRDALYAIEPLLAPIAPDAAAAARKATMLHSLSDLGPPPWIDQVGRAVVEDCFELRDETEDAVHLALVARYPRAPRQHVVMVLVDLNLNGIAKDLLVSDRPDDVRAEAAATEGLTVSDLGLGEARARIEAALAMTVRVLDAPVSDDFAEVLPMLRLLLDSMPEPTTLPAPERPTGDELDALVEQLLDAPETAASELTREQLDRAASLTIRYCAEFSGRSPLAWSPTRLEMLLLDFVPRWVDAPPEDLADLPQALTDLVPAAQRLAGWEDRYVDETLELLQAMSEDFAEVIAARTTAMGSDPGRAVAEQLAAQLLPDEVGAGAGAGAGAANDTETETDTDETEPT